MANLNLDARLSAVATLVRHGSIVADIGTDHAYLPAYLVGTGVCPRAIASDLRVGPLENARETVRAFGLEDRIQTVLSDGLDALTPGCCDDVILAGMGGILIAELLARTPWLCAPDIRVIAQPMSHHEDVRRFFFEHGFSLREEVCAVDGRHCYCAMAAEYTGASISYTPAQPYVGLLPTLATPQAALFSEKQFARLKKRRDALRVSRGETPEVAELTAVLNDFLHYLPQKEQKL